MDNNVILRNCLQSLGDLIGHFFGLFSKLSPALILPGITSQIAALGLLARIFIPVLLIGLILMNIFPFEPIARCEHCDNINQYLYEILEVHLLNLMHPPVAENVAGLFNENMPDSEKAVLQIFMHPNFRNKDPTEFLVQFKSNRSLEFRINDIELQSRQSLDKLVTEECSNSDLIATIIEYKYDESDLDAPEILKTLRQVDMSLQQIENPEDIAVESENIDGENASALTVFHAESTEQREKKFIDKMSSIQIENARLSIASLKSSTISLKNINIERVTVHSSISEIMINDNTDEIERVISVINPDSMLDNNQDQEFVGRRRENSEDIEVLLSVDECNGSDIDSIITR